MAMRGALLMALVCVRGSGGEPEGEPKVYDIEFRDVTCGSAIKLQHKQSSTYLYVNGKLNYGSGSGQQAVTAMNRYIYFPPFSCTCGPPVLVLVPC